MMQGKALVGGQLEGEWVKTQVLRALCDQQLVMVDAITRVYHLTEQGRERLAEVQTSTQDITEYVSSSASDASFEKTETEAIAPLSINQGVRMS